MNQAEHVQIYVSILSTVLAGLASILALYVTVRLYKFKDDLMVKLNGTYIKSDVFAPWKVRIESDISKCEKGLDEVHEKINATNIHVAGLQRR